MMGWICPKCGAVYGPLVSECGRCNGAPVVTCAGAGDAGGEESRAFAERLFGAHSQTGERAPVTGIDVVISGPAPPPALPWMRRR